MQVQCLIVPFATLETRRRLGRISFRQDFWDCYWDTLFSYWLDCEQALQGALAAGQEKKGELATMSLEFEYLRQKSRCKMLIGGDDISNDVITLQMCFLMFVYLRAHLCPMLIGRNLTAQSMRSDRETGGEIQIPVT